MADLQRCNLESAFKPVEEYKALMLADFYKMFSDSSRVQILYLLKGREICVNHIASVLNMTISGVSHQLRLLRAAGLVRFVREGKNIYYALDDKHVEDMLNIAEEHLSHKE